MTIRQKAQFVMDTLDSLYPKPSIPLSHTNNFTVLVAVMLSAQCTDKRVNEVTPKLFAIADTPEKMSQLSQEEIMVKKLFLNLKK